MPPGWWPLLPQCCSRRGLRRGRQRWPGLPCTAGWCPQPDGRRPRCFRALPRLAGWPWLRSCRLAAPVSEVVSVPAPGWLPSVKGRGSQAVLGTSGRPSSAGQSPGRSLGWAALGDHVQPLPQDGSPGLCGRTGSLSWPLPSGSPRQSVYLDPAISRVPWSKRKMCTWGQGCGSRSRDAREWCAAPGTDRHQQARTPGQSAAQRGRPGRGGQRPRARPHACRRRQQQ